MSLPPDLVARVYDLADAQTRLRIRATAKALWPYLPPVVPGRGISAAAALEGALVRAVQFLRKFGKLARQSLWRPQFYAVGRWRITWSPPSGLSGGSLGQVDVIFARGAWLVYHSFVSMEITIRNGAYMLKWPERVFWLAVVPEASGTAGVR